jgi:small-conductance mechanosensitive channel
VREVVTLPTVPTIFTLKATQPSPQEEIAESAESLWETILGALPRVGYAIVVIVAGWLTARGLRWILRRVMSRRRTPSFATVMSSLVSWVFLAVVVLLSLAVTFPSVRPVDVLAGLGFFSVAVGFAFQDILENLLSGVLLLFRQPFRAGDHIDVVGQTGIVIEINIRETQIMTFDGELVIVPNRDVYKNVIVVSTHQPIRRLEFGVGVAYQSDIDEAVDVIKRTLVEVPGVNRDPAPAALVDELGDSAVKVRALFWTSSDPISTIGVLDTAIRSVKSTLESRGIEIPPPTTAVTATPSLAEALRGTATDTGPHRQHTRSTTRDTIC